MLSDEDDGTVDGINAGNFKDIIYVDDTQQEVQPGDAMSTGITNNSWEYQNWAHTYSPADVVFQTGYDSAGFETCSVPTDMQGIRDVRWWALLQNPIQDIMQATFNYNYDGDVFPQEPGRQYSVVWVDFSARSNIGSLNIFNAKTKTMDPNNRMSVHVNPPPLGHWPLSCIY
jgi:hypothetical protein